MGLSGRFFSQVDLKQATNQAGKDPGDIQNDQDTVSIVDRLHEIVRIYQPVDRDPDTQQHNGKLYGWFEGIINNIIQMVWRTGDERLKHFPAEQRDQLDNYNSSYNNKDGDTPAFQRIPP